MKKPLLFALAVLCASCSSIEYNDDSFSHHCTFEVNVGTECNNTKTTLSGTKLSWEDDDKIGIFVDGLQYNSHFFRVHDNVFRGSFIKRGEVRNRVNYVGYYPFRDNGYDVHTNNVHGELSIKQIAPFDSQSDYIVSDVLTDQYDETNLPALKLAFNNHLFSIIKVTLINTDNTRTDEYIKGISIKADGTVLSGAFSFNVMDALKTLEFSKDELLVSDEVSVIYNKDDSPVLGHNISHTIYAVVNCVTVADIQLSIMTSSGVSTKTISLNKKLLGGHITNIDPVDVGLLKPVKRHRTAVYWGDSIAPTTLTDYLATLLGDDWTVVNGGVPGDTPIEISGRMGGAPICIMDNITIPGEASKSIDISGIYSTFGSNGSPVDSPSIKLYNNYRHYSYGNHSLINNCTVNGEECVICRDVNTGQLSIHRSSNGNAINVSPKTTIFTYGNTHYRDADVIICYMGANGGNWDNYSALVRFYQSMIDYGMSGKFIVVGFHYTISKSISWSQEYVDLFSEKFGNKYLDLKTVGAKQGERLLIEVGPYSVPSQITDLDKSLMESGCWPASWQVDYKTNVHPNEYGSRAIAIMVYEKMRSLGYLSN